MFRFDFDRYREILDTISRNKSRSILTGFGVFWGIFMLVGLIGGGQGMKEMLENNFTGFANNSSIVWAQSTSKAFKGFRKGRWWKMTYTDVERMEQQIPELDVVSPVISAWGGGASRDRFRSSCVVKGLQPNYAKVETPKLRYGRYINDIDLRQHRKVCVLGKKVYQELYPGGGDPCGSYIRIDSIYYQVVGVNVSAGDFNINGSSEESVFLPITVMQQAYNRGDDVDLIVFTGRPGVQLSGLQQQVREVIGRHHFVDPTDEQAIRIFNTEVMFTMMDNLFVGVNFLIWLVGIGTLLAGAIGVSNIMMVTVKERTVEIGIRRAIGATPSNILSQIIMESIILTSLAGFAGILFAVMILNGVELGTTTNGALAAHFQVSFQTALFAVLILIVLGVLAGLAPALRAMHIKPVDAMRDE